MSQKNKNGGEMVQSGHKFCIVRVGTNYFVIRQKVLSVLIITITLNMSLKVQQTDNGVNIFSIHTHFQTASKPNRFPLDETHTLNRCVSWHTDIAKMKRCKRRKEQIAKRKPLTSTSSTDEYKKKKRKKNATRYKILDVFFRFRYAWRHFIRSPVYTVNIPTTNNLLQATTTCRSRLQTNTNKPN